MRRPRYSGKYPRKFEQRYKELNPETFPDAIAHIESRGRTPVGQHKPILLTQILSSLNPQAGDRACDLTLGFGGHATEILKRVGPTGQLFGFDQDPLELPKTTLRLHAAGFSSTQFVPVAANFRQLESQLRAHGVEKVNVILADLGLSSMQIDQPDRGFNTRVESPLDLRMNPNMGEPAHVVLQRLTVDQLSVIFREYGDEPFPHRIARELKTRVPAESLATTFGFQSAVLKIVKRIPRYPGDTDKASRRLLQALRIFVNDELQALADVLEHVPRCLESGGRVAFLTFHSGEDRLVKNFFLKGLDSGVFKSVEGPVHPTSDEVALNRRSRSAKLRWGIRT